MKHIFHTIRHAARAATVLLLALLAAQTAGAQTDVSDADGFATAFNDPTVSVINVTDNITGVGYLSSINRALTINLNGHTISGDELNFYVGPKGSLTINGGDGSVGNIIRGYANEPAIISEGTVTLSHVNITTNAACAILGTGTLYIGNNVSFNGWTGMPFNTEDVKITGNYNYDPEDYDPFANVVATVTVGGKTHYFENLGAALVYIAKHPDTTLFTPDLSADFSWSGDTYTIHTDTGWDFFCDMLEAGETFSGKTVELDGDITVSRMAGGSGHSFTGTFDGQNHKLTLAYGTADAPVDAQFVAPFVETARDTSPVFRNLTIDGTIYATHTAATDHDHVGGLIGHLFGTVTIEHCVSRVEIHAKGGAGGFVGLCEHSVSFTDCHSSAVVHSADGSNSGFVAWSRSSSWEINFTGCLFDGKLLQQNGTGHSNGGFIGWKGDAKTVNITNCLCAPATLADGETMAKDGSATFSREHSDHPATIKNSYYTQTLGNAQGKQARAVTAGTDVTIEAIALTGTATQYTVSGITAYSGGGLQRGETLYYGIDDNVSLTLSNTATGAPDGYQYGYTTNAGTLSGSTLTMPNQDVTVSVNTEVLVAIDWATVSTGDDKDNAYMIYNKDQLDLLAYRVNGTHGETCQTDGYSGKYFKLGKDIKYTHKADGEEGADAENNYEAIGGYYDDDYRYFCGHFDGNNNTISGIRIYKNGNADSYQGIFGLTGSGADIHHLTLADARITGHDSTGGIVGENAGGTVTHCHVAADVAVCAVQYNAWYHGGIVGYNLGTIEQCTSAATLTTADADNSYCYGGIAGYNSSRGTLHDNLAIGATVPAAAYNTYGAITGDNTGGTLQRNYYTACKVANTPNATGVGCKAADVTANNGAVSIHTLTLADGITTSTAATVTHAGTGYYAQGTAIALSYSGTIGDGYQLGIVRNDGNGFTAAVADGDGNYTAVMPAADATATDHAPIDWATVSTGDDKDNAYMIYNNDQLDLLAHRVNGTHGETCQTDGYSGKYFQLAKDIKYTHKADGEEGADTENNYEAIGGYYDGFRSFCGHFDGNNNTISGIRIYKGGSGLANDYQGIFGRTDGADIHHLTLADARITGCNYTGGIVGENNGGTVTRCHVASDVAVYAVKSSAWNHGGIVGYNDGGTIELCTSAATLTTADATSTQFYGGIAGWNYGGILCDNLAIGATVPAAAYNTYGAITGHNYTGGTLQRNYYAACKVANTPNATGVGCGCIDNGNGGRITADVTANNGAVSIHTLTLADGITTTTAVTVTIGTTGYYAQGTAIALSYSGTPGDAPLGYQYGFTASAGTLSGSTLIMPDQDVTVSALRSTGKPVPVSYVDAGGNTLTHDAIAIDGTETDLGTDDEETWYFVGLPTVAFDHTLHLNGNVHLILADGCTMNVTSSKGNGIDVNGSLTIYGQTDGTGTLNATGGNTGIFTDSGTITISGGRVTATGGNGAGIYTDSGTITISGGTVTATGGNGGIYTYSGTITISGGTVTATGDNNGIYPYSGNLTISGGRVTATGDNGYGIYTESATITLGCTTASDFIYASRYFVDSEGKLNIADGQKLYDEDGNSYSGNGVTIPNGKTLRLSPGIDLTARKAPDGNYWTTYYNGTTGFTIDKNENACAYTATYDDGQLTLHKLGKEIPKNTAVIIVADNDEVSMATTVLDDFNDPNDLLGVDVDTPTSDLGTGTFYVLGMTTVGGEKHFGFHRYTGEEMAAHKAFVLVDNSQARSLTMVFDEATAIQGLTPDAAPKPQAADHWFTLDGRRLQAKPTAPGIYINNGRKVVIK